MSGDANGPEIAHSSFKYGKVILDQHKLIKTAHFPRNYSWRQQVIQSARVAFVKSLYYESQFFSLSPRQ